MRFLRLRSREWREPVPPWVLVAMFAFYLLLTIPINGCFDSVGQEFAEQTERIVEAGRVE